MELQINGTLKTIESNATVTAMLTQLRVEAPLFIVERNGAVIPREQHDTAILKSGDRIEIVVLMGGG